MFTRIWMDFALRIRLAKASPRAMPLIHLFQSLERRTRLMEFFIPLPLISEEELLTRKEMPPTPRGSIIFLRPNLYSCPRTHTPLNLQPFWFALVRPFGRKMRSGGLSISDWTVNYTNEWDGLDSMVISKLEQWTEKPQILSRVHHINIATATITSNKPVGGRNELEVNYHWRKRRYSGEGPNWINKINSTIKKIVTHERSRIVFV